MPQLGYVDDAGLELKFEDVWKMDFFAGLPTEVLYKMYLENLPSNRPATITATTLLGCARKAHLQRTRDYYVNPRFNYGAFRGTLIHSALEGINDLYKTESIIQEQRYFDTIPGTDIEISGKIDKYIHETNTLVDYKTCDDTKVANLVEEMPQNYVWQTNIYKWLLEKKGLIVKKIKIIFFTWKYVYTSGEMGLVCPKWFSPEWKKLAEAPIYPNSKVEDFMYSKAKNITRTKMPPALEKDQQFLCEGCPFKKMVCFKESI